jgi:hypothetical protein
VQAQYVDPDAPAIQQAADEVLERFAEAVDSGWTRGELDAQLDELCSERRDHKMVRGLAKIASDRTDYASDAEVDPAAFRREVFLAARAAGPLSMERGPLERPIADDVLSAVGAQHGLDVAAARQALYADLKESHQVLACRVPSPQWLLDRYNVALAQAVLYQAEEVRLELPSPTAPRMRQLLRWVRFHQLIASSERADDALVVTLDGPQSLFRQSTRYGTNLARFLPAFLLHEPPWRLEATVRWTKAGHRKTFTITPDDALVSHYADQGAYRTEAQRHFEAGFDALDTKWTRHDGSELIPLGPKRVIYPDYTFRCGKRTAHLQWVGFWRRESLLAHLEAVERYGPPGLILAVSTRLAGSKDPVELPDRCLLYKGVLSPKKLIQKLDSRF